MAKTNIQKTLAIVQIVLLVLVLGLQMKSLKKDYRSDKKDKAVELLFVQEAASASVATEGENQVLTLTGVDADTVYFADRPDRVAGTQSTESFVDEWAAGADSFADDAPNAALKVAGSDEVYIVELLEPSYDAAAQTLSYRVVPVGDTGELPVSMESPSLFIDSSAGAHLCVWKVCVSGGGSINP